MIVGHIIDNLLTSIKGPVPFFKQLTDVWSPLLLVPLFNWKMGDLFLHLDPLSSWRMVGLLHFHLVEAWFKLKMVDF